MIFTLYMLLITWSLSLVSARESILASTTTKISQSKTTNCYLGEYVVASPPFGNCAGYRPCEKGYYCEEGKRLQCPAGFFGNSTSLSSSICSGECPPGHYCPIGTVNPIPCDSSSTYCPKGSKEPQIVPDGYYSIGVDNSISTSTTTDNRFRYTIKICPLAHFCKNGVRTVCPGGTYGNKEGISAPICSGLCLEGFYCPPGSYTPFDFPCPNSPKYYCPTGSTHPIPTGEGYYAVNSTRETTGGGYTAQEICPPGSYCIDGIRELCPAGRYGTSVQMINSSCSGICRAGFYCPKGSTISSQIQCTAANIYCPEGSAEPLIVSLGYYTIGSTSNYSYSFSTGEKVDYQLESMIDGNSKLLQRANAAQVICPKGSYCLGDGNNNNN